MSGGSHEYMMSVMLSTNGSPCVGRDSSNTSGFAGSYCYTSGTSTGVSFPAAKYYDKYANGKDSLHYERRILGDATGEIGPFGNVTYSNQIRQISSWHADEAWFVESGSPWFGRGTNAMYGSGAGAFAIARHTGTVGSSHTFRIVLAFR